MTLLLGDSLERLRELADNSVDAVCTDPPYGLAFMGKKWDYDVPSVELWREVYRVMKPGAHLLSFGGTRTYHRMVVAIEDAGFEIRDQIMWIYGSGFPKSLDVSKAIDKAAGAEREVVGVKAKTRADNPSSGSPKGGRSSGEIFDDACDVMPLTAPSTDLAKQWQGWGTALKPANEPIVLARKPLERGLTVAQNVAKWGTGAINVDAGRIGTEQTETRRGVTQTGPGGWKTTGFEMPQTKLNPPGRWPANVLFDEEAAAMLDAQSGVLKSGALNRANIVAQNKTYGAAPKGRTGEYGPTSGGASRFFYVAKAAKKERSLGLDSSLRIVSKYECENKDVLTAAAQLLQKVTSELTVKWLIAENGKSISAQCPKECKSTISTEISKIIESKILNALTLLLTKESTPDANLSVVSGGSLVASVTNLKAWLLTITSGETALALGASRAASETLHSINESEDWPSLANFHSTVKPIKLMEYLCKLVTPPGGVILDPFMGSGTTGCAARKLGFEFIGCEMSVEYMEIARKRIEHWERGA